MNGMCEVFIDKQSCFADIFHYFSEINVEDPGRDQQS